MGLETGRFCPGKKGRAGMKLAGARSQRESESAVDRNRLRGQELRYLPPPQPENSTQKPKGQDRAGGEFEQSGTHWSRVSTVGMDRGSGDKDSRKTFE